MKVKRLYDAFAPSSYNLNLKINKTKLVFSGKVRISGIVKQKNISILLDLCKKFFIEKKQIFAFV